MADLKPELIEKFLGERVLDIKSGPGCAEGDNVAGSLLSVEVRTPGGTRHLVWKNLSTVTETMKNWIIEFEVFRTEHTVYKTLLPMLADLAHKKGCLDYQLPAPKFYGGFNDNKNDFLVLEDVRPQGFIMPNKFEGLTLLETKLIMRHLAKFHALTYFFLKYHGEKVFEEIPDFKRFHNTHMDHVKEEDVPDTIYYGSYLNAVELMEKRNPDLGARMRLQLRNSYKLRHVPFEETDKLYFPCIIHGDLWMNNILIRYDPDTKEPIDVKFVDFQFTRRGNIFMELQYLLFTSITPEMRRLHLSEILFAYYDAFECHLSQLKCPVPLGFTRGTFVDSFKNCYLTAFAHMTFAIPLQLGNLSKLLNPDSSKEREPKTPKEKRDFFVDSLRYQMETSEPALMRMEAIVQEMVDENVL